MASKLPKLVGIAFKLTEKEKFTVVCSCSPQNLKLGHFTLLFCRGRQRNVSKFKMHVRSDCFCSNVVAAVVVAKQGSQTYLAFGYKCLKNHNSVNIAPTKIILALTKILRLTLGCGPKY